MKKIVWIVIFLPFVAKANKIDSLKSLLGGMSDSSNFQIYDLLGKEFFSVDLDSAIFYQKLGLEQAKILNNRRYLGRFHAKLGESYFFKGWSKLSIQHYEEAYVIKKEEGNPFNIVKGLNNLGIVNLRMGNYEKSGRLFFEGILIAEASDNYFALSYLNSNIGRLYYLQGEFYKSRDYYNRALVWAVKVGDKKALADIYHRIGMLFSKLDSGFDSTMYYSEKSFKIRKEINDISGQIDNHLMMSSSYMKMGAGLKAMEQIRKANSLNNILKSATKQAEIDYKLAKYNIEVGDFATALEYYHKELINEKRASQPNNIKHIYYEISEVHKALHQYDSALFYFERYATLKDSLFNIQKSRQIAELEKIYQTEKKEKEIQQLRQEKGRKQKQLILLISIIALLIVLIVFSLVFYRIKQKAKVLQVVSDEQKKHFKAVLKVQEDERKRIAAELHDSVGPLLSVTQLYISEIVDAGDKNEETMALGQKSYNTINEAVNEVRGISHNLMPGVLVRLGLVPACRELVRKITETKAFEIGFSETGYKGRLDESLEVSYYRILQELLNNTIKHSRATKVEVAIQQEKGVLTLKVRDNGVGFDTENIKNFEGIGLQGIYSRLTLINGAINIDSGKNGTTTEITAPVKEIA